MIQSKPGRRVFVGLIALLLLVLLSALSSAGTVQAAAADLFFSEYIEGSSNNKALEIYNGTGASVDLATNAYNVQMFFNGSATAGLTINLTGTVANGDVFVVAQASANAAILAQADLTSSAGWFNGDDAVVLRKGTTILDVIGVIGSDPGTEWGTALTSTMDNTLSRKSSICQGDTNGADAFDPSIEWDGFATDTSSALGSHTANCGVVTPNLSINDVSANEGNAGTTSFDFTVTLSSAAGPGGVTFDIATQDNSATAGSDYTANSLTGQTIPEGSSNYAFSVLVNGDTDSAEPEETFFVNVTNVTGANVTDGQGQGTILNDDVNPCTLPYTFIYDIQGSGASAAITGNVTTQGVVVGDFEGTSSASGFFLQDPLGDGNPNTSDGIFVFTGSTPLVNLGDMVRVSGFARERFNQTALNGSNSNTSPVTSIVNCGTGGVAATDIFLPFASATDPERFEGMLVRFPQSLVIAEYFNYDQFGEIVLALPLDGEPRPFTGTALDEPGAAANARTLANSLRRITLDDAQGGSNPSVLRHPNGAPFALDNRFRGGDLVANTVGVLGFDFSLYRIFPTGPADYTAVNPRPASPEDVGGTVRVAAMNTLNFFITPDYPNTPPNPLDNKCGGLANLECRGHDSDQPDEFNRQRNKLLAALSGLNADIIGLNEIENTPGVDPLANIVSGLPGYGYIDTGVIGTDAIRVGLIYRSGVVTPVGAFQVLDSTDDPRFIDTRSRPTLAQTFEVNATGARVTVAVNHLKSKGSACADIGDPDVGDGQGNCNQTRLAAAQALVDWLATDPTGSGDPDFLIIGDLNSYAREDPIDAIKAGADDTLGTGDDYTNLIEQFGGTFAYSYTFDGQAGYLDHALAIAALAPQVTGASEWHINSDEPDAVDYDTTFKPPAQEALYEPNPYRSSDHDAVIVGLDLDAPPTADAGGDYNVDEGGSVTFSATATDPNGGTLTYEWDLDNDGTFETPGQSVTFSAAGRDGPDSQVIKVRVTDSTGLSDKDKATVNIHNVAPAVDTPTTTPAPSNPNQAVTASATFSDPAAALDEPFTCTVDYGDGSGAQPGTVSGNTCTGASHPYIAVGQYTVTVAVTDKDGDTGSNSVTHNVGYAFNGFFSPVDNRPTFNVVKAGSNVPVKFSLGGNFGLDIFADGFPKSQEIPCNTNGDTDGIEETGSPGGSSLQYHAASDTYQYNWKTKKAWSGTCRQLVLRFNDGTTRRANFQFK
jgi:predicted extracellular nuclease